MRVIIKGIAFLILLVIIVLFIFCFLLGKCSLFEKIPIIGKLNISGSGRSNQGAQGSGKGSSNISPPTSNNPPSFTSRFTGIDWPPKKPQQQPKAQQQQKQKGKCEGLDPVSWFFCHVSNGLDIVTSKIPVIGTNPLVTPRGVIVPVP